MTLSNLNQTAYAAFANTIYDVIGLGRLLDEINLIERSLFKDKAGTISEKARDYLTGGVISIFEEIEKAGLEPEGDQKQLQFLKDLVNFLDNLPQVKVSVAFDPTHSFVMRLNNQISAVLGSKVILDVTVDESLIGGAVFEYKGRISQQTLGGDLNDKLVSLVEKAYGQKETLSKSSNLASKALASKAWP